MSRRHRNSGTLREMRQMSWGGCAKLGIIVHLKVMLLLQHALRSMKWS